MFNYDVIVVGGGLVGGAFALDLAQQNPKFNIAVLEHKEYVEADFTSLENKIYAISPENVAYLTSIGAWPDASRIGTIKAMDVSGDAGGNILLDTKLAKRLYLAKTIEYKYLQHELYLKLRDMTNITFIYDQLSDLIINSDNAELIGAINNYTTRLVVGADGANSFIRNKSNIESNMIDYESCGVVANFSCELPHRNIASQWFKDDSILAYLPLPDKQISIVWSGGEYKELLELSDNDFCIRVAEFGENKLGKLELITKAVAFPLRLYLLDKVYADKVILIGDAAHTIHPLAGQGVNLGFGDSSLLAATLAKCQNYQLSDKSILIKYNATRLLNVRQMQLSCHSLQRIFTSHNPVLEKIRNQGLNIINKSSIIKKYLIKKAIAY